MFKQACLVAGLTLCSHGPALAQRSGGFPPPQEPGVTLRVFQIDEDLIRIPVMVESQTPNFDSVRATVDFAANGPSAAGGFGGIITGSGTSIFAEVTGWLRITTPGDYHFRLTSDDGSRFTLNGEVAADNDGNHAMIAVESGPIPLAAGQHPLRVDYYDHAGAKGLRLEWKQPGQGEYTLIPTDALRTHTDLTRVTSPGYKAIEGGRRAGDSKPLKAVHPMWELTTFRPADFEPLVGAMCFDAQGRLIVGTFDPLQRDDVSLPDIESKEPDSLYAVSESSAVVVAEGFLEPAGLVAVGDDLYVSHRRAITRLRDTDNDGFYETHQDVATGWEGWNYHQFAFGLVHTPGPIADHPGHLYATLSTAMAPPDWQGQGTNATVNGPMRGTVIEVDLSIPDPAQSARVIAGGTRTPNGLGVGPEGSLWYADNQGTWMPTNQFTHVTPGRFFGHHNRTNLVPKLADRFPEGGHPSVYSNLSRTPASVLLPHGEASNSPTQSQLITEGPFAGQMLLAELTAGGIRRVFLEKVNGEWQGAVFRHSQGFESGLNRMVWGPGGSLYVGGIGAEGNWKWKETRHGLQKLTPTGHTAFEMLSVRAQSQGFAIEFTKPVYARWLRDKSNYRVTSWTYEPTSEYGGPKIDERTHTVNQAMVLDEPRVQTTQRVVLLLDQLEAGRCYRIHLDPVSAEGEQIWSPEAWYTLNAIPPLSRPATTTIAEQPFETGGLGVGTLPTEHASVLIGASADGAMRRGNEANLSRNQTRTSDEVLALPGYVECGMGTGDLVSAWELGDHRLHVEWLSPPGGAGQMAGNSGVYLQGRYEVQVLGTRSIEQGGPDVPALNEAGAIYNIRVPDTNASNGPGQWQAYDIWFRAPRFLDGEKTEDARMTVFWNGVLVHHDVVVPHPTGSAQGGGESAPPHTPPGAVGIQTGSLRMQDHGSAAEGPVLYRNIWVEPLTPTAYIPDGDWIDLINDAEWVPLGGKATYEIDNGTVIGTAVPNTPNTFLTTTQEFVDFELLYEARQHTDLNSGVQIRSSSVGGIENRDGALVGYQIEMDPSDRAYSGGVYDESRRGWLTPLVDQPYSRRAYRPGEWNQFRVLAEGDRVRTWVNGIPAANMLDAMTATGHIGLQVHNVGNNTTPMTVEWRNMRLRVLKPAE